MTYELFKKLGYVYNKGIGDEFSFRNKTDFMEKTVWFYPNTKEFHVSECEWYDFTERTGWIPMEQRKEVLKHCATYGKWVVHDGFINQELHSAINEVISSLGW